MLKKTCLYFIALSLCFLMIGCSSNPVEQDTITTTQETTLPTIGSSQDDILSTEPSLAGSTWVIESATDSNGDEIPQSALIAAFGELEYQFADDGNLIMTIKGATNNGSYSQKGDKVTISILEKTSTFTLEDNKLIGSANGASVVFVEK